MEENNAPRSGISSEREGDLGFPEGGLVGSCEIKLIELFNRRGNKKNFWGFGGQAFTHPMGRAHLVFLQEFH